MIVNDRSGKSRRPNSAVLVWVCVALLGSASVLAWNDTGHMTVAELAWRRLSHTERVAIGNLLRQHPHYSLFLTNGLKAGVDESEWHSSRRLRGRISCARPIMAPRFTVTTDRLGITPGHPMLSSHVPKERAPLGSLSAAGSWREHAR